MNRNIWNIIQKYNDTSIDTLIKIKNIMHCPINKWQKVTSVMDLIVKCYQLGFTGFYIDKTIKQYIINMKKYIDNDHIKIYEDDLACYVYIYIPNSKNDQCIHISQLLTHSFQV